MQGIQGLSLIVVYCFEQAAHCKVYASVLVGRAILPAGPLSSEPSRLERRQRSRLAAPQIYCTARFTVVDGTPFIVTTSGCDPDAAPAGTSALIW